MPKASWAISRMRAMSPGGEGGVEEAVVVRGEDHSAPHTFGHPLLVQHERVVVGDAEGE